MHALLTSHVVLRRYGNFTHRMGLRNAINIPSIENIEKRITVPGKCETGLSKIKRFSLHSATT